MASPWLLADQQRRRAAQAEELARLTQPSGLAGQSFGYARQNNPIPNEQSIYDRFVQENQVTPPARSVPDPPNVQAARKAVASYGVPWKEAADTGAHAMQQVFEPISGAVMGVQSQLEGDQQKIDAAKKSLFMGGQGPNASELAMQRTMGAVDLDPNEPAASRAATTAIKTPWEALPLVIGPGEVLSGGKMLAKPTNAMARKLHQAILSRAKEAGRGETLFSLGPVDAARLQEIKEKLPTLATGSNEYRNLKAEQRALSQKSIADDLEQASMERAAQRSEELGPEKYVSDMKIGKGEEATANLTRPDPIRKRSGRVTGGSDDAQKIIMRIDQLTSEGKFKREYKNAISKAIDNLGLQEGDEVLADLRARLADYPANKGEWNIIQARKAKASAEPVPREPVISPETQAEFKAAAEKAGNPEYADKVIARAEEMAPAQQSLPTMEKHVPPPSPPKIPPSQKPVGTSGNRHYGIERRWGPTIENEMVSKPEPQTMIQKLRAAIRDNIPFIGGAKPRQRDQLVGWTDPITGQKMSAPMRDVEAHAIDSTRVANTKRIEILGRMHDVTNSAEASLRSNPTLLKRMEEPAFSLVPGAIDRRLKAIQEGLINAGSADEKFIVDAYQKGIMQVPRDVAHEYGLSRMNKHGMIEPIDAVGSSDVYIQAQGGEWMQKLRDGTVPDEAFEIIVDYNKALGNDITLEATKTQLVGYAKNLEQDTAIEFGRTVFLPSQVKLKNGRTFDVLKPELLSRDGSLEPGLLQSLTEGQARTLGYKIAFGQDFGEGAQAAALVKSFRAANPNHPVPVSRAREMKQALGDKGRGQDFDRLISSYWGRDITPEGASVTAFPAGKHAFGSLGDEAVKSGDRAIGLLSKLSIMDLFARQPTQPLRDLPRLVGWKNTIKGMMRAWSGATQGAERAGRLPDRFMIHAAQQDNWASQVAVNLIDRPFARLNNKVTLINDAAAYEGGLLYLDEVSEMARNNKLGIQHIRRLKEDLKLPDEFIDNLKTVQPGTPEYAAMRTQIGDAVDAASQFTGRQMQHGGKLAESGNRALSWTLPLVRKYASSNLRATADVFRIARDAMFKEGLSNAQRKQLGVEFFRQLANKGIGIGIDAGWGAAYLYASGLALQEARKSLGSKGQKEREFSWMKNFIGATTLGPAGDILNRAMEKHDWGDALASMSIPGNIANELTFNSPAVSNKGVMLHLIDGLGKILPGPVAEKYIAMFAAMVAGGKMAYDSAFPTQGATEKTRRAPEAAKPEEPAAEPTRVKRFSEKYADPPKRSFSDKYGGGQTKSFSDKYGVSGTKKTFSEKYGVQP